ncbi:MAG: hypothetical protein ACODAQ_09665 [Phycisphaeraceae bacterium]
MPHFLPLLPRHLLTLGMIVALALCAAPLQAQSDAAPEGPPRIALLATYYQKNSHADAIGTKFIEGFPLMDGSVRQPRVEIVSMWIDQTTDDDLGHQKAAQHDIPIHDTIREALTLGGDDLAVDGVLFIGEHGDYPRNRFGSKMYPRLRILDQVFTVFDEVGRSVPVFNDKMLSHNWFDAKWVIDRAADLDVPLMAGSVLPVSPRVPEMEHEKGVKIAEAVAVGYGSIDAYGFHVLEMLQCMVERRAGGETGVASVRCVQGEEVYELAERGVFSMELVEAACEGAERRRGRTMRENEPNPTAMIIDYRDGTRAAALIATRHVGEFWGYAARLDDGRIVRTEFRLDEDSGLFPHFSYQCLNLERMFLTGEPVIPAERTLVTSGILDAALRSLKNDGETYPTPHMMDLTYQPPADEVIRPR